jgi:hypothetical protein
MLLRTAIVGLVITSLVACAAPLPKSPQAVGFASASDDGAPSAAPLGVPPLSAWADDAPAAAGSGEPGTPPAAPSGPNTLGQPPSSPSPATPAKPAGAQNAPMHMGGIPLTVVPRPCPSPCEPPPCGNPCTYRAYAGLSADVWPGLGGGLHVGKVFAGDDCKEWSWELGVSYQDLSFEFDNEKSYGKFFTGEAGFKVSFLPQSCGHPVVRAGLEWMAVTGKPSIVKISDIPNRDDYLGAYVSLGYEFQLCRGVRTGPEARIFGGLGVGQGDFAWVPTLRWNLIFDL